MNPLSKDVVLAAWRKFSSRDIAQIEACLTEDAVWVAPKRNATAIALGRPETYRMDRHQIASFIANDFGRLFVADLDMELTGVYSDGDTVVLEQRMRATLANGRKYDNNYCFVF